MPSQAQSVTLPASIDGINSGINSLSSILSLLNGSSTTQNTSGSTSSTQTVMSPLAIQSVLNQILGGANGLAATVSGQNVAGLYNSSTNELLTNDLLARTTADVAAQGAPKVTTSSPSSVTVTKNPQLTGASAGKTLLTAAGAYIGNHLLQRSGLLTKVNSGLDSAYDAVFGSPAEAVSAVPSSVGSIDAASLASSAGSTDAAISSALGASAVSDLGVGASAITGASAAEDAAVGAGAAGATATGVDLGASAVGAPALDVGATAAADAAATDVAAAGATDVASTIVADAGGGGILDGIGALGSLFAFL